MYQHRERPGNLLTFIYLFYAQKFGELVWLSMNQNVVERFAENRTNGHGNPTRFWIKFARNITNTAGMNENCQSILRRCILIKVDRAL